jgi:hypothetical protein
MSSASCFRIWEKGNTAGALSSMAMTITMESTVKILVPLSDRCEAQHNVYTSWVYDLSLDVEGEASPLKLQTA